MAEEAPVDPDAGLHLVKSPIVGTYYGSPSPGASPFVSPGEHVDKGQVICIEMCIRDSAEAAEALVKMSADPVEGNFDSAHLKEIHRRIFQNIYPWAGQFRQVNMNRLASYPFAVVQFMEQNLDSTFSELAAEKHLRGLDVDAFASRAG